MSNPMAPLHFSEGLVNVDGLLSALDLRGAKGSLLPAAIKPSQIARDLKLALGEIHIAIDEREHHNRIRYALSQNLFPLTKLANKAEGERIAVVGSGPSLKDSLPYLRQAKHKIIACNAAHDYLLKNGVKPWAGVILDPNDWCAGYQTPTEGVGYFIGSTVHHSVWKRFRESGIKPWLFVPVLTDTEHEKVLATYSNEFCFVAGATTVGLRAFNIAIHLGARVIEAHGFDSCYAPGANDLHAHEKPVVNHDRRTVTLRSRVSQHSISCETNGAMAKQIIGFKSFVDGLPTHAANGRQGYTRIVVAGDGAIPWMAWKDGGPQRYLEHLTPDTMLAKYGDCSEYDYAKSICRSTEFDDLKQFAITPTEKKCPTSATN